MSRVIYDGPKFRFERKCYQVLTGHTPEHVEIRMNGLRSVYKTYRRHGIPPHAARMATIGNYWRWFE